MICNAVLSPCFRILWRLPKKFRPTVGTIFFITWKRGVPDGRSFSLQGGRWQMDMGHVLSPITRSQQPR